MSTKISKGFYSAYLKGRKAFIEHGEKAICPYRDLRTNYHNGATFSRAYIKYWLAGLRDEKEGKETYTK